MVANSLELAELYSCKSLYVILKTNLFAILNHLHEIKENPYTRKLYI